VEFPLAAFCGPFAESAFAVSGDGSIIPRMTKVCLLPILALSVSLQAARMHSLESSDGYRERFVSGTVVAVKPELSLITIREPDLLGHLRLRFKSYHVRQSSVLDHLQAGDKIRGVFSSRDSMLHRVRRVQNSQVFGPILSR
jgi:hypothetical protein